MITKEERLEIPENEINLIDYFKVLIKRKVLIGSVVFIAIIVSAIYSRFLPDIYVSTVTIFPPQEENSIANSIASQLPMGVGGILGLKTSAGFWVAILKSQTIMDAIAVKLNLMKDFKVNSIENAGAILRGMAKVSQNNEGLISITVEDRDPKRAALLANTFVEELDKINKGIVMTSGKRTRLFVEKRLKEAENELAKAEEAMKRFQENNRAIKLDEQSSAVIGAIGSLKGQVIAKEVELQTLLSYATPTNPQVEILRTQMTELKERLRELEEGKIKHDNPSSKDIFIPTSKIPDLSLQYARLLRDAKLQQTLHELLSQQYEMARIQEAKDTPTVQVLDEAKVPEKRSKPNRRQIVMLSTVSSAFFGIFAAFLIEYIQRVTKK